MYNIKQSTAQTLLFFAHDENGDAVTGLTDGSFTKRISKAGTFAAMTVTISEQENGWYSFTLSTSHSDALGILTIVFTNGGAKQVNLQFRVEAKLVDDLNDIAATAIVSGGAIDTTAGAVDTVTTNVDMRGTDSALLAASINLTAGAVDNVTTVATTTTNTDMRGTDSAATATALATVDGVVDAILLDTSDLQANQGAWTTATGFATAGDSMGLTAGAIDAILDEALVGHNVAGSIGKSIRQILEGTVSNESSVVDESATTTSFVTALTETIDNHYKDTSLVFIDGALKGQSRPIFGYDGTTKTITIDEAFTESPSNGDSFIIKTDHVHPISEISDYIDANSTQLAAMILEIAAVKVKTDSLTFTVGGQIDSNARSMNNVAITGAGTTGDPWT